MNNKPASVNINLIPKDPFFDTAAGRALQWALSIGRYIVIFTEIVVILSFAARFTLDRQVADLNKSMLNQKATIESFGDLEEKFRLAQAQISEYESIAQDTNLTEVFINLTRVTPQDASVRDLTILPNSVRISGSTLSQQSFNLLITNLQLSPHFLNVTVSKVEAKKNNEPGLNFEISADTKEVKRANSGPATPEQPDLLDRTQGL